MWRSLCAASSTRAVSYSLKCVNAKRISSHRGVSPPFHSNFPNVGRGVAKSKENFGTRTFKNVSIELDQS